MPSKFDQQITFLHTHKLDQIQAFYHGTLGLSLIKDQGDCLIFAVTETSYLGFCLRPVSGNPAPLILTLVTDEVWKWYEHLTSQGITTDSPPKHNPKYSITHFFLRDPQGYRIEIQQFDTPLPTS